MSFRVFIPGAVAFCTGGKSDNKITLEIIILRLKKRGGGYMLTNQAAYRMQNNAGNKCDGVERKECVAEVQRFAVKQIKQKTTTVSANQNVDKR